MRSPIVQRLGALVAVLGLAIAVPLAVTASHQYSDVPDSSAYHADIDALTDSGITNGCGGGKYCPKAYVTREQMAAFMNRLGALQPGKTPVVHAWTAESAGSLQGITLEELAPLWAIVRFDGVLQGGRAATEAGQNSTGVYHVNFDRDVTGCAWTATLAESGGQINVKASLGTNVITVNTYDAAGAAANRSFHLLVTCINFQVN